MTDHFAISLAGRAGRVRHSPCRAARALSAAARHCQKRQIGRKLHPKAVISGESPPMRLAKSGEEVSPAALALQHSRTAKDSGGGLIGLLGDPCSLNLVSRREETYPR
jgi:hypothetical protein